MIETVAEHSFQTLRPGSKILDIGCRGFQFTDEMKRRGHHVCSVDIDKLDREDYFQIAVSNYVGRAGVHRSDDPQATSMCEGDEVMCMTIEMLSTFAKVPFWDLIKIDVEGSEREIIYSLEKPPARQLSIEFHLHTGAYRKEQVDDMVQYLEMMGYKTAKHGFSSAHGCGYNYWDSLFVL